MESRTETIVAAAFRLREGAPAPRDLEAAAFHEKPFPKFDRLLQACPAFAPFICTRFQEQGKRAGSRRETARRSRSGLWAGDRMLQASP